MSRGASPPEVRGEEQTARWVRAMFGRIAHRYDLLNHLLSFQLDRYWRVRTVRHVRDILERPGARVLDMCCGSGDLMLALDAAAPRGALVVGSDFAHPMLIVARHKIARRRSRALLVEADALRLPLGDASVDLVTAAFGFRNLASYERGLEEMLRVLMPGGLAAILEFSQPPNALFAGVYRLYAQRVLPAVGGWISGSREAYAYLPDSVSKFPSAEVLARQMEAAGFEAVGFERMSGGIVSLHRGEKPLS
jgi:demethylmenaquinone methyltransferase/2-methoxy-6-polyprenyl-1,4-benzoquinol methylase